MNNFSFQSGQSGRPGGPQSPQTPPRASAGRRWLERVCEPLRALYSIQFYFGVLFKMRGSGLRYLGVLALLLALPAAYQVSRVLELCRSLELPAQVMRLPPSHFDSTGRLWPDDPETGLMLLRNSHNQPVLAYNPGGEQLDEEAGTAFIEMAPREMYVGSGSTRQSLPYVALFPAGESFERARLAAALEMIFTASPLLLFAIMAVWFAVVLIFNALLCGLLSRLLLQLFQVQLALSSAIRMCAYANTAVVLVLLVQLCLKVPLNYGTLVLIPLLYMLIFALEMRRQLRNMGIEGFTRFYGLQTVSDGESDEAARRRHEAYVDELTGRAASGVQPQDAEDGADAQGAEPPPSHRSGPGSFVP